MKELDYDLIESVGAEYYSALSGELYKLAPRALEVLSDSGVWRPTITSHAYILCNIKPIPPQSKPNIEYIKAEFSEPWQAAKAFCDGAEFWRGDALGKFCKVASQGEALRLSGIGNLYTRKEIESDWHKALADFLDGCENLDMDAKLSEATVRSDHSWDKKWHEEYIESCRVVLRELGELK